MDHFRKQKWARERGMQSLPADGCEPGDDRDQRSATRNLLSFPRGGAGAAWEASIAEIRSAGGKPYHTVLHFKIQNPKLAGAEMAERLGAVFGGPISDAATRKLLHRAQFADLLLDEVSRTLGTPSNEELGQELSDLRMPRVLQVGTVTAQQASRVKCSFDNM